MVNISYLINNARSLVSESKIKYYGLFKLIGQNDNFIGKGKSRINDL